MSSGHKTTLDFAELLFPPSLQAREGIDLEHAERISQAVKAGEEIERLEVYEVHEPAHDGYFVTDGFKRGKAYELAGKKKAIPVVIHKGTWNDALRAAATANKQWDSQGTPRSNKALERACIMYAQSFADVPKSERPNSRDAAAAVGVSKSFWNNLNLFGKGKDTDEDDKEIKVRRKKKAAKAAGAETADPTDNKAGLAFDFEQYDNHMKWMISGFEVMGETFDLAKTKEFKDADEALNDFVGYVKEARKHYGRKKAEKAAEPKKEEPKKNEKPKKKPAKKKPAKPEKPKDDAPKDEDGFPLTYDDEKEPSDAELEAVGK